MTSVSVSLPQTASLQPKTSAVTTALPFLKAFPPDAWTVTVTCSPDPLQGTDSKPKPSATPDPDRWETLTKRSTLPVPLQVTSSGTSIAAPRARSLAGDSTWTSRNSPAEKNPMAGPEVANSVSRPPRRMATTAVATLVRLVLIRLLCLIGNGLLVGRSGGRCWEHEAAQQRHGEDDGWQVPDKVEAAMDGEGHRCRHHPSPGAGCAAGGARAPQQPRRRGQQDGEQDQAHQAEFRRELEVLVVNIGVQVGAMVGSLPSQLGLSGSGAGQGMLGDQPQGRLQRPGPVG